MSDRASRLLSSIHRVASVLGRRRRIGHVVVLQAFDDAFPNLRGHPSSREELHELLGELEKAGALVLPRSKRSFDMVREPAIPLWIDLPRPPKATSAREKASGLAWHPALEFVATLERLQEAELEHLLDVQSFLASLDPDEPVLTTRERSLRIFGDDKLLERLAAGRFFGVGRLSLELLRCRTIHAPFVFEDFAEGDEALILENKDTYASACQARLDARPCSVRWIIFGAGKAVQASFASFLEFRDRPGRVLYFGDLDVEGVEILRDLRRQNVRDPRLPSVTPATQLYEELVRVARLPSAEPRALRDPRIEWLPDGLQGSVTALLDAGGSCPQEWITRRELLAFLTRT